MRVPLSWLGEWVDLPEDVSLASVHAALVSVGFEEEDIHVSDISGPVVVGQVISAVPEPQTNGKTINWCQVDVGEAEPRGIVCGAHNFSAGDKVVVTLPGAVLPGPFPIAARKTYGHVSDGMIASARELGLGDEHDGILRLAELGLDPEVGAAAIPLLGLDDAAVEINVTPDRGYALSIRGVAREYSHATGAAFRDPVLAVSVSEASGYAVSIDDTAPIRGRVGASAFAARTVRGIDPTRPTPPWMASRLRLAGIRSISLTVDITNYVMLEFGQPTHGYDLDRLRGGIVVRRAVAGETIETLDGQTRKLITEDLLITDDSGPIGLAGVMGGATVEISSSTTDVLVEAANFDPISIARSARRHKLPSEASRRFERGVDPTIGPAAAARVVQLLVEFGGGTADTLGATINETAEPAPVSLPLDLSTRLVGVEYTPDQVVDTLRTIGADVAVDGEVATVTPPSWRPDLTDAPDLVEEVARIIGYSAIPSVLPVAPPGRGLTRSQRTRRRVAQALADAGSTEVLAYPFVSPSDIETFEPGATAVRLANPLDPASPFLRRSLLPGLLAIAHRNLSRGMIDLALSETGLVFLPTEEPLGTPDVPFGAARPAASDLDRLNDSIPAQPWHVATVALGQATTKQPGQPAVPIGLADALDSVQQIVAAVGGAVAIVQGEHPALHPGRTAEIRVGERIIGYAGELLPALAESLDLPRVVAVAELDIDLLLELTPERHATGTLSTQPAATQDLSLVVAASVPAGEVLAAVIEGSGVLLEAAELVDDYRGSGLAEGTKSLTFALRFRAEDRTLTAAEATESKLAGVKLAADRFGATLRE